MQWDHLDLPQGTVPARVVWTNLTIRQLLQATDDLTDLDEQLAGFAHIYDTNGDGVIDSHEAALRTQANELYSLINEQGDI